MVKLFGSWFNVPNPVAREFGSRGKRGFAFGVGQAVVDCVRGGTNRQKQKKDKKQGDFEKYRPFWKSPDFVNPGTDPDRF